MSCKNTTVCTFLHALVPAVFHTFLEGAGAGLRKDGFYGRLVTNALLLICPASKCTGGVTSNLLLPGRKCPPLTYSWIYDYKAALSFARPLACSLLPETRNFEAFPTPPPILGLSLQAEAEQGRVCSGDFHGAPLFCLSFEKIRSHPGTLDDIREIECKF